MIVDFGEIEDGAEIAADICIVGAGAAGIAMARSFIGSGLRVCLLESGGYELDGDTQSLYEGDVIGRDYYPLDSCRLRYFGGTTNHWAGWCGPFTPYDLQAKSWVPHSGWPLRMTDLEPYYQRAQPVFEVGPFVYDERLWPEFGITPPMLEKAKLALRYWRQRVPFPLNFAGAYGPELQAATTVQVILNANVVRIETNPEGTAVTALALRSIGGRGARAVARAYVLACGGIENARLLLASNDVRPNGLGNDNDLVGRFFMDHLGARCATVLTPSPIDFVSLFARYRVETVRAWAGFGLSDELQEREQCLNVALWVDAIEDSDSGPAAVRDLWHTLASGDWPSDLSSRLLNIVTDLDEVADHFSRRAFDGRVPPYPMQDISLFSEAEQSPNPESRVTLSEELDLLGVPKPVLDWRPSAIDKRSIRVLVEAVGAELGRLNLARLKIEDWLLEDGNSWPDDLRGAYHHVGTTRMSDDPRTGVVDRDCRLHGVSNLYVAGSSVFPTEGYVNPTLTIVALALRLGDHLGEELA